jgi:hypothetical protein
MESNEGNVIDSNQTGQTIQTRQTVCKDRGSVRREELYVNATGTEDFVGGAVCAYNCMVPWYMN